MIDLLLGLREPREGSILFDGADYRDVSVGALRDAVVGIRGDEVFSGTPIENITLGRALLSPGDTREALRAVGLFDELIALPEGLKTQLQPEGLPLSSSQTARLAIARAIAGQPRLLIVDDLSERIEDREMHARVMERLHDPDAPWTLIRFCGDESQGDFDRVLQWSDGALADYTVGGTSS